MNHRRESGEFDPAIAIFGSLAGALVVGGMLASFVDSGDAAPVHHHYKSQITHELENSFGSVSKVSARPYDDNAFAFNTFNEYGQAERCHGHFAVRQAAAVISGQLVTCKVNDTTQILVP